MRIIATTSRLIAGLIFIFSGLVKAVDPLGSTYKFTDYFTAFNMPWLEPVAFPLSFLLSGMEFLIGICLVLSILNKPANWGALLFMAFFTPLTLWLALTDPVQDCGCFGDAIILTNWQTFYKNIFISALVIISFLNRKTVINWFNTKTQWGIAAFIAFLITGFSWYNFRHLPVVDFRPYKIGVNITEGMVRPEDAPADIYDQYYTLLDTVSDNQITLQGNVYLSDSTYWKKTATWKFVSASEPVLIKKGFEPPIHDFSISALSGEDITQSVLNDPGYYFLLVAYDLNKTEIRHQGAINQLYEQAVNGNNKFICLTSVSIGEIEQFKSENKAPYDFYTADPITLKTIIRANPGLVILHKGTILAKWHSNDIPDYNTISSKYFGK